MKLFAAVITFLAANLAAIFSMILGLCSVEFWPQYINNEYEMIFVIISGSIILPFIFFAIASNMAKYITNHKKVGGIL
jgi:Na+/H+-dicarboxylate symporter